ncbi:L-rhamnose-binding lectin CSL2-like [Aplochiton taeniatus]
MQTQAGGGEVIIVQRALYGRSDRTTCSAGRPPGQLIDTHCKQGGTLEVLSARCNGRQVCELNTQVFRLSNLCFGTFKYLDTTYTCIPAKL